MERNGQVATAREGVRTRFSPTTKLLRSWKGKKLTVRLVSDDHQPIHATLSEWDRFNLVVESPEWGMVLLPKHSILYVMLDQDLDNMPAGSRGTAAQRG